MPNQEHEPIEGSVLGAEQVPDLEHTRFIVRGIRESVVKGQRILIANMTEIGPNEDGRTAEKVEEMVATLRDDGGYDIEEYFDTQEVRKAIDDYLAQEGEGLRKAA